MQPPARCSNHRCVYIDQCVNGSITRGSRNFRQGVGGGGVRKNSDNVFRHKLFYRGVSMVYLKENLSLSVTCVFEGSLNDVIMAQHAKS